MTINLPTLTGSPKQIAWAERIRRENAKYNPFMTCIVNGKNTVEELISITAKIEATGTEKQKVRLWQARIAIAICTETSAAWYIDHEGDFGPEYFGKA